jgi:hypothetical protein
MENRNQYLGQQIQRSYPMEESTNTNNMTEVATRTHGMLYACVGKLIDFFILRGIGKIAKRVIIVLLQFAVQHPKLSSKLSFGFHK